MLSLPSRGILFSQRILCLHFSSKSNLNVYLIYSITCGSNRQLHPLWDLPLPKADRTFGRKTLCDSRDCSPPDSCPWDFSGKNTGVGCHFLLQGQGGGLPNPGITPGSPAFAGRLFTRE